MIAAAYQYPNSGIDMGRVVVRVLQRMDWSLKHAALEMELDEATFSRAIHGLGPLDLHRLALLPSAFWWKLFRVVIRAAIQREETQQQQQVRNDMKRLA